MFSSLRSGKLLLKVMPVSEEGSCLKRDSFLLQETPNKLMTNALADKSEVKDALLIMNSEDLKNDKTKGLKRFQPFSLYKIPVIF